MLGARGLPLFIFSSLLIIREDVEDQDGSKILCLPNSTAVLYCKA